MHRTPLVLLLAASFAATSPAQNASTPRHPAKPRAKLPAHAAQPDAVAPLTERERAVQMLNRFTFGARPGDVDRVLAIGVGKWLEQQLRPESIKNAALDKRLADFPALNMTPEQALAAFPDRGTIQRIVDGKQPMPTDPMLAAIYEVQIAKLRAQMAASKPGAMDSSDAEKAAEKQQGQITAARIAGQLLAMPRAQRMAALIAMPVEERSAFATYVSGDQKNMLMAEFSPREREMVQAMGANVGAQYFIGQELAQAKMVRAILSERQLQEVMADFWFNHFNIYLGKDSDQWYTTSYERDVIRKYALGKFGDLLLATAQSPAMLVYLDNWLSIGPDSLANGVNPKNAKSKPGNKGLNENYGREVMELHTVSVNGGYSQADVTNLSAILTGWTVDRPYQAGGFQYDPKRHEPGAKTWLGHRIGSGAPFVIQGASAEQAAAAAKSASPMEDEMMMDGGAEKTVAVASAPGNEGMKEGLEALNLLAHSPQTAHFICRKIAQRFVADEPPASLVEHMAQTFLSSDGDIKQVLRTLAASPEFNSRKYFRNKVKTPMEFLVSAYRTTLTEPTNPGALVNAMRTMGMPLYQALPPTGYYITADKWMNTSALVDRLNFAYQLTSGRFAGQRFDAPRVVALGLMSEPVVATAAGVSSPQAARHSKPEWTETALKKAPEPAGATSGSEVALRVLEETLVGGAVSPKTSELIHKQLAQATEQGTPPADMLNVLTALVMGSPEFQMR
jgi:uncharacterized protein (DUF1800 family)